MTKLYPMKVVLSVIDPEYPNDVRTEALVNNETVLKQAIKLADRNGLYYYFVQRLRELNFDLASSSLDIERWNSELRNLSALKKTLAFLNEMQKRYGIDYILIKACTMIPHVPRDIDIFVQVEDSAKIYELFEREGMKIAYSNPVETAFDKEGYMKLDIYSKIQYVGMNFIDSEFLWDSKVGDEMFGINYTSLNSDANFLLLLVHSLFGHRSMTLLDFLHMKTLMRFIDKRACREYAYENGWGMVLDMGLERLEDLYETIYKDGGNISFPYLFNRKFMLDCVGSIKGLEMKRREKVFFNISLGLDRFVYELRKSPFYDYLMAFDMGRRVFNSVGYFVRNRRGDRHGIYGEEDATQRSHSEKLR